PGNRTLGNVDVFDRSDGLNEIKSNHKKISKYRFNATMEVTFQPRMQAEATHTSVGKPLLAVLY
ncbi:MAG: hypothetical protein OER96_14025, partial [Gammaproteobacteria bacterium]|nr:hypothetical protein [Gammaproteobacteria bacterium]